MDDNKTGAPEFYNPVHLSSREAEEMDQGRFACPDCGEFYAPDGTDVREDCPAPRPPRHVN